MNNQNLINLLITLAIVVLFAIMTLVCIWAAAYFKNKLEKKAKLENKAGRKVKKYDKENIENFMKFEKVEDDMVIEEGNKFLMFLECQGVNFDVMSDLEKIKVEQGFINTLDSLKFPIQKII